MFKATYNNVMFNVQNLLREMWVRCCFYCFLALVPFVIGPALSGYIPGSFKEIVSTDALQKILTVMASSMLAVTTFSLSIMVQALQAAASTATPRASKLLMQDGAAQNVLGAFIGSFLFSIVGIVGLSAGFYHEGVVVILFVLTLAMILLVTVMLIQWIRKLAKLGRVSLTIKLIEDTLCEAINSYMSQGTTQTQILRMATTDLKRDFYSIFLSGIGYVQYIDYETLQEIAVEFDLDIYLSVMPGDFIDSTDSCLFVSKKVDEEGAQRLKKCIAINRERTFSQDPRYGFIVLTEVALRALSPGINDAGTAIDVIHTQVRVFEWWRDAQNREPLVESSEKNASRAHKATVYAKRVTVDDILEDMYLPLVDAAKPHLLVCRELRRNLQAIGKMCNRTDKPAAEKWLKHFESLCETCMSKEQLALMRKL